MPSKEELREQIQVMFDYLKREEVKPEDQVAFATDHLWGTVGMWLNIQYIEGAIDSPNVGYPPVLDEMYAEQQAVEMGEIDEHEGEVKV